MVVNGIHPLVICYIAIENCHRKCMDLPINSMVDLSSSLCVNAYQMVRNWGYHHNLWSALWLDSDHSPVTSLFLHPTIDIVSTTSVSSAGDKPTDLWNGF